MVLRQKLRETKMTKSKNVSSYLTRISQVRDELGAIGEKVDDAKLVRVALNGFSQPWHDFLRAVVARENLPSWARLWDDFTQECRKFRVLLFAGLCHISWFSLTAGFTLAVSYL